MAVSVVNVAGIGYAGFVYFCLTDFFAAAAAAAAFVDNAVVLAAACSAVVRASVSWFTKLLSMSFKPSAQGEPSNASPLLPRSGSEQASAGAGSAAGAVGSPYPLNEDAERPEKGEPYKDLFFSCRCIRRLPAALQTFWVRASLRAPKRDGVAGRVMYSSPPLSPLFSLTNVHNT